MRGATRSRRHGSHYVSISTHAPLAGRDVNELTHPSNHRCISTHAPLAGRDEELTDQGKQRCEFQPTRPLRGATAKKFSVSIHTEISTHAPLAGRDASKTSILVGELAFQPTRPLRGATCSTQQTTQTRPNFNPRAPCGARRLLFSQFPLLFRFQPTRPLRGATHKTLVNGTAYEVFQPTRPLRGATAKVYKSLCTFLR